jgi:glycosyltransferase involved in cell wall biosynthesis
MWRADCELLGTAPDERAEYVPSGQLLYVEHDGGLHCYGQPQRNFGALVARGQYLAWLGDDDIYLPGAFASIAAHIRASEPAPHLFRWISPWKTLLWEAPGSIGVEPGHIDAECIITPNLEQYLGTWENRYQGDFDFIQGTLERWARAGVPPRWCAETIAQAQPSELEDWTRHDALTREQAYARQTA